MIRKHKKYIRPRQSFDSERIKAEDIIVKRYGLKNKKEIWKAKAKLDLLRSQAKKLMYSSEETQKVFIEKVNKKGYNLKECVDVLALNEEDILKRRLQTIVLKKGIATTPKGARQMITHKKIRVNGNIVNIPSYHVKKGEDEKIQKVLKDLKKTKLNKPEKEK
jgi:small subunit ribosomal protein S4